MKMRAQSGAFKPIVRRTGPVAPRALVQAQHRIGGGELARRGGVGVEILHLDPLHTLERREQAGKIQRAKPIGRLAREAPVHHHVGVAVIAMIVAARVIVRMVIV